MFTLLHLVSLAASSIEQVNGDHAGGNRDRSVTACQEYGDFPVAAQIHEIRRFECHGFSLLIVHWFLDRWVQA
jgi:hypothetical protein